MPYQQDIEGNAMFRIAIMRKLQSKIHKAVKKFVKGFRSWGWNNTTTDISVPIMPKIDTTKHAVTMGGKSWGFIQK